MASPNPANPPPPKVSHTTHWPTIKVYRPPLGVYSPRTDERCISYFSQSVTGRIHNSVPYTKTICLRRVFKHEVANVLAHRPHAGVDIDGIAHYPLPPEGQPAPGLDEDGKPQPWSPPPLEDVKYYQEGWYIWYSSNKYASHEKLDLMRDLPAQAKWDASKAAKHAKWMAAESRYTQSLPKDMTGAPAQPRPAPPALDPTRGAVLVHIRPPSIFTKVEKLAGPVKNLLSAVQEAHENKFLSGFAARAVDAVKTGGPLKLMRATWDKWRKTFGDGE